MKTNCLNCGKENPKSGMKNCSRKCIDELKKKRSREKRICLFCNEEFEVRKKEEKTLCSEVCRKQWSILPENINKRIEASKLAIKEQFGVDNVFQLKSVKDKSKKSKIRLYGDENYNNSDQMHVTKQKKYGNDYGKEWYKKMSAEMMKNFGVVHPLQTEFYLDKLKKTNLEKYGFKFPGQPIQSKNKIKKTNLEKYGVENISQNESIKEKKKETSIKNFGVSHHLKDSEMFQKHQKAQYKILEYKNSGLYYNGSYEKYFLELLDEKRLLHEVHNGSSFEYEFDGKKHTYHTDYIFRSQHMEIKSGWTYNKNGKDTTLQSLNEAKWSSVKNAGEQIIVLINKSEISGFVKAL